MRVTIRPPGREPYNLTIDQLTAHVRAARMLRMGRLADTLKRASEAKAGLETAVDSDVKNYIERVDAIHKRRADVFFQKHTELDADVTDLAEFERDLEDFAKNDRSGDGESIKTNAGNDDGNAYRGTSPPKL